MSKSQFKSRCAILAAAIGICLAGPAVAGLEKVPPSSQSVSESVPCSTLVCSSYKSYSLEDAAKLTADFNISSHEIYPNNLPFQVLYVPPSGSSNNTGGTDLEFHVKQGTWLYVPVLWNDNSEPVMGGSENFPPADSRSGLLKYYYSDKLMGLKYGAILVDGQEFVLGSRHIVEVPYQKAYGDRSIYQTVAGFVQPLKKGVHEVEISALMTGDALSPYPEWYPNGVFYFAVKYKIVVE